MKLVNIVLISLNKKSNYFFKETVLGASKEFSRININIARWITTPVQRVSYRCPAIKLSSPTQIPFNEISKTYKKTFCYFPYSLSLFFFFFFFLIKKLLINTGLEFTRDKIVCRADFLLTNKERCLKRLA
jgi:hypothetical protein